jgi:hypothetical protein
VGIEVVPIEDDDVVATTRQDPRRCTASQTRTQHHDSHDNIIALVVGAVTPADWQAMDQSELGS